MNRQHFFHNSYELKKIVKYIHMQYILTIVNICMYIPKIMAAVEFFGQCSIGLNAFCIFFFIKTMDFVAQNFFLSKIQYFHEKSERNNGEKISIRRIYISYLFINIQIFLRNSLYFNQFSYFVVLWSISVEYCVFTNWFIGTLTYIFILFVKFLYQRNK